MITAYQAKYFAYELTRRFPSESNEKLAGTLVDAQVDLNPHQVEAALFAFRSPLSKGAKMPQIMQTHTVGNLGFMFLYLTTL